MLRLARRKLTIPPDAQIDLIGLLKFLSGNPIRMVASIRIRRYGSHLRV